MKIDRLLGLDALRGAAAFVVLLSHCIYLFMPNVFGSMDLARMAYLAVDFFFILSGYVIARMLSLRPMGASELIWARYRRFWPVMAVGTAIGLLAFVVDNRSLPDALTLLGGLAMIPVLTNGFIFALNPPAWSIFFELFANVVHAFVRKRPWPFIWLIALTTMAVSKDMGAGPTPEDFLGGFGRVLVSYAMGVLLFEWWRDEPPIKLPPWWSGLMLLLLLPISSTWFYYGFVFIACPLMMASALRWQPRWGTFVGDLSFPLYAVHYPVLLLLHQLGPVIAGLASIGVAWVVVQLGISKPRRRKDPADAKPAEATP